MPLRNILLDISSVLGLDLSKSSELAYHIAKINEAGEELYNSCDLPGSIIEQVFQQGDEDTSQYSLPYQVGSIRGMKHKFFGEAKINVRDLLPRYHCSNWNNVGLLDHRIKSTDSPLCRDIISAGPLNFVLSSVESGDVVIELVCKTQHSDKITDVVTIPAGQVSKVSIVTPIEVESIVVSSGPRTYNITVKDINDRVMSVIPNFLVSPLYTIVNVRDPNYQFTTDVVPLTIEVLYKLRYRPFINLSDEFPVPNCDKLIFWKFAEHYASYKPGWEERSILAAKKIQQLKGELFMNDELGKEMDIQFGRNPFNQIHEDIELGLCYNDGYYLGWHK